MEKPAAPNRPNGPARSGPADAGQRPTSARSIGRPRRGCGLWPSKPRTRRPRRGKRPMRVGPRPTQRGSQRRCGRPSKLAHARPTHIDLAKKTKRTLRYSLINPRSRVLCNESCIFAVKTPYNVSPWIYTLPHLASKAEHRRGRGNRSVAVLAGRLRRWLSTAWTSRRGAGSQSGAVPGYRAGHRGGVGA